MKKTLKTLIIAYIALLTANTIQSQAIIELNGNNIVDAEIQFFQEDTLALSYTTFEELILFLNDELTIGFFGGNEFGPALNGTMTLGSSAFRWSEIWSTNGLNMTSDIRLKKNISSLGYGLSEIRKMRPISFNWKEGSPIKRLGFSAQEMQEVIPEIVQHHIMTQEEIDKAVRSGRKGFEVESYGIDYIGLIPVLVESISELADQVDDLKKEIQALKGSKN